LFNHAYCRHFVQNSIYLVSVLITLWSQMAREPSCAITQVNYRAHVSRVRVQFASRSIRIYRYSCSMRLILNIQNESHGSFIAYFNAVFCPVPIYADCESIQCTRITRLRRDSSISLLPAKHEFFLTAARNYLKSYQVRVTCARV